MNKPDTTVVPQFAADERCDRCGAAAKLRVRLAVGGDLLFCGHHANRYVKTIRRAASGVDVEAGFEWRAAPELVTA